MTVKKTRCHLFVCLYGVRFFFFATTLFDIISGAHVIIQFDSVLFGNDPVKSRIKLIFTTENWLRNVCYGNG